MPKQVEYWRWWIKDEVTGRERRTSFAMSQEIALARYPTAHPDEATREVRTVYQPGEYPPANSKPGG